MFYDLILKRVKSMIEIQYKSRHKKISEVPVSSPFLFKDNLFKVRVVWVKCVYERQNKCIFSRLILN